MMTSSQIIREAMKHLRRAKFICVAIDNVLPYSIKHLPIKKDIRSRMEEHYTLEEWLVANGHVEKLPDHQSKEMKEYRLRWMEHLAQEYEAKGD